MRKKAWIVNPYGALPSEGWLEYRSYKLAKELLSRGYEVIVWTSKFEHRKKNFRSKIAFEENSDIENGFQVIGIDGPGYSSNISLKRIRHEGKFGESFYEQAIELDPPEIIIIGDPSIFFSKRIIEYSKKNNVKLIVDIIDLWPELFKVVLPKFISSFDRLIFNFLYKRRDKLLSVCDGVVGCTSDYVERVNPPSNKPTEVAYFGIDTDIFNNPKISKHSEAVKSFTDDSSLSVIFAGTYGSAYDIETIFKTIELTEKEKAPVKYLFIGDGDYLKDIKKIENEFSKSVMVLDSMPLDELVHIYNFFDVGLCTYSKGSTVSMPTKFYDNLGAGLVTITSLNGEILSLVNKHKLGLKYEAGNHISLFEAIMKLKNNKQLLIDLKSNANLSAHEFSAISQYKKFADFIEKIIA